MQLRLSDKYMQREGSVFLTGMEAIVRLLLEKQRRDLAEGDGHVNQTYVSGYEGSPIGGLDLKIVEQLDLLNRDGRTIHEFGINEKTAEGYAARDACVFFSVGVGRRMRRGV